MDRDYAASLNILKKATQGHWGSWSDDSALNAWGNLPSSSIGAILSGYGELKNQESPSEAVLSQRRVSKSLDSK